ncbi:MAG TPA: peptidase S8, partial [Lysobacter sp.]
MSSQPASRNRRTIRISALAAGLLLSGVALADAQLDPQLIAKMAAAAGTDELQVVISYAQSVPVTAGQVAALKSLGISKGVTMRTLPIAGALATPA